MIIPLAINFTLALIAALSANDTLKWHSYIFYGLQMLTLFPFLLRRARFVKNLFLPSVFVLFYFLVNLTFGSYLVPRGFGWDKEFADIALRMSTYRVIVPFLLLSNMVLFVLSVRALRQLRQIDDAEGGAPGVAHRDAPAIALVRSLLLFAAFFAVSYLDVYSVFSFQLALLILHFTDPSFRRSPLRYVAYGYYLAVLLAFSFENKREIAMVLFLVIFMEAYYSRIRLNLTLKSLTACVLGGVSFFTLIMAASILRGYGAFEVTSIVDALGFVPQYLTSDMFVDGITDNLELNYSYGVTITSIDHTIRSLIPYQLGGSLVKVFFLPIPRDIFPFKPGSIMQVFTQEYAPQYWADDGSLPVMFAADMFINFHYLGLFAYAAVFYAINKLFVRFHTARLGCVISSSCLFLCITILMFARGSGLEQWLLYFLLGLPVLLTFGVAGNYLRTKPPGVSRWVV